MCVRVAYLQFTFSWASCIAQLVTDEEAEGELGPAPRDWAPLGLRTGLSAYATCLPLPAREAWSHSPGQPGGKATRQQRVDEPAGPCH